MILTDYFRIWRSVENTIHKRTSRIRQLRSGNGLAVQERNSANKYQWFICHPFLHNQILKKNHWDSEINTTHTLTCWASSMANTVTKINYNHNLNKKPLCFCVILVTAKQTHLYVQCLQNPNLLALHILLWRKIIHLSVRNYSLKSISAFYFYMLQQWFTQPWEECWCWTNQPKKPLKQNLSKHQAVKINQATSTSYTQ